MASRKIPFVNGEYYHVFNRGVAKMPIFHNAHDFRRFTKTMLYYQKDGIKPRFSFTTDKALDISAFPNNVSLICYCLMPNHFHLLVKQEKEGGITEFISKLSNSYTKYYNTKRKRIGPLFQGEFKAVHIQTTEQLLHLSRYIHLNPLIGYVTKALPLYKWSSYHEYINNNGVIKICEKSIILNQFKTIEAYKVFITDHEKYARELEIIKHQLLDDP